MQNNQNSTRQRVVSQAPAQNTAREGRGIVKLLSLATSIAICVGVVGIDAIYSKPVAAIADEVSTNTNDDNHYDFSLPSEKDNSSTSNASNNVAELTATPTIAPVATATPTIAPVATSTPTVVPTITPTGVPATSATPAPQVMGNTGNALNEQEVNQRVVVILQEFRNAGIINNETGVEYTFDEIKDLLLYMNGAYVPEDENEAYTMYNKFLNMVCAPINTKKMLDTINYMGGNTAISKEQIDTNNAKYPAVNWMNFMLGDSNCSEFLSWFDQQVMLMNSTSDKDVYNRTFEVVSQALANLCFGNGCVVNGHTYTMDDFMGLDDVNDGNLLQLLVYIYQVGRNQNVAQEYRITSGYSDAIVSLDSILACFNPACTLTSSNVSINDDGLVVMTEDGATFATINQVNTINNALSNYYSQGLGRYDDIYQKTK